MENKVRYLRLNSSTNKSGSRFSVLKSLISVRYFCFYIKPIAIVVLTSILLWHLFNLKATKEKYSSQLPYVHDDFLNVSVERSKNSENPCYKILFWTAYYEKRDLGFRRFTCPGNRHCVITFNQSEQDDADALLFNAVDLEIEKRGLNNFYVNLYDSLRRKGEAKVLIILCEAPQSELPTKSLFFYMENARGTKMLHESEMSEKFAHYFRHLIAVNSNIPFIKYKIEKEGEALLIVQCPSCRNVRIEQKCGRVSREVGYIPKNLPKKRKWDVPWIISLFESPEHVLVDLRVFHGIFNWTWSFRRDADIHGQEIYQRLEDNDRLQSVDQVKGHIDIMNKTKLVAWIVSNCDLQPSNRNYLVQLLRKYIPIDVYGDCGRKSCSTTSGIKCYEEIARDYKFYLAFENSLCVDYTTEKFSSALDVGMVPILYGFGNITEPKGAFINVFDFETVEQLAMRLLFLDKHPGEYAKYFHWRKIYGRIPEDSFLCDVCEKVSTLKEEGIKNKMQDIKASNAIEFLWDWWTHTRNRNGKKNLGLFPPRLSFEKSPTSFHILVAAT